MEQVPDLYTGEVYCVKCKAKKEITDALVETNSKGARMARGLCPDCGTKVTRFLPRVKAVQ